MRKAESVSDNLVDPTQLQDLLCGICLGLLQDPRQCVNGHLFCFHCVSRVLFENEKDDKESICPICRINISPSTLSRSLYVEKAISSLKKFCKYRSKEKGGEGCKEVFNLDLIKEHEKVCQYRYVGCPNGCAKKVRVVHLEHHKEHCELRPIQCKYCENEVFAMKLKAHIDSCFMVPLKCQDCQVEVLRKDYDVHRKDLCPEQEVECMFAESGCRERMKRKMLEQHLRDNAFTHMGMLKVGPNSI